MKKLLPKIIAVVLLLAVLSACSRTEFTDIYGFTERFDYGNLNVTDFLYEKDGEIYYTFFDRDNPRVMLKLICTAENKIDEVRIYLPKYDENADKRPVTAEDISLFIKVISSALKAFTGSDKAASEELINEMHLYEKKAYKNEGELTKTKNNFHFIYHSASLGSEFIIYNTYLKQVPETEKPESRPMYGDTTKIRTETAPSK